jgi:hypothetical protein
MELMNTRAIFKDRLNHTAHGGLASHMDAIILKKTLFLKNPLTPKTVYIYRHELVDYTDINRILNRLDHPVNVIIAGSDCTFPNNIDVRFKPLRDAAQFKRLGLHPRVHKLFVENLDEDIPNTLPIPLGLNRNEGPVTMDFFSKYVNIDPSKPLLCTNFNRTRNGAGVWAERKKVFDLCETAWKLFIGFHGNTNTHEEFLEKMGENAFTICVHGGGLDVNPKLWEALLIGVIPIIRENKPYTDIYVREDLPVVIVKRWHPRTINSRKLQKWHHLYYGYFTDPPKRERMLTQLSLEYWVNYVRG